MKAAILLVLALTGAASTADAATWRASHPRRAEVNARLANENRRIAVERRRYNETVQDYNTFIALFPNSLVASMGGFTRNDAYFKTEEGARQVPKVSFGAPSATPQLAPTKP